MDLLALLTLLAQRSCIDRGAGGGTGMPTGRDGWMVGGVPYRADRAVCVCSSGCLATTILVPTQTATVASEGVPACRCSICRATHESVWSCTVLFLLSALSSA